MANELLASLLFEMRTTVDVKLPQLISYYRDEMLKAGVIEQLSEHFESDEKNVNAAVSTLLYKIEFLRQGSPDHDHSLPISVCYQQIAKVYSQSGPSHVDVAL